jgi:glycosyltransferase involved in cell wall biosynthesis
VNPTVYTLVVPVYRNRESLPDLLEQLRMLDRSLPAPLETVFVVDGSPDDSHAWLRAELPRSGLTARLLLLSRNFGSFAAARAGLAEGRGQYFAVIAADLQEPPELALQLFTELASGDVDLVVGMRQGREDPLLARAFSSLFWFLYRKVIQPQVPPGGVDLFGCNRAFRDELVRLGEANTSLVALLFWLGYRRKAIPYTRLARRHGKSAWTLRRKLKYLSDSVFGFSDLPVRLLFYTGFCGLLVSGMLGVAVLVARVTGGIDLPGYSATMLVILFFGALNTFGLGVVGSYAWRAYENTKQRPGYLILSNEAFGGGSR